MSDPKRDRRDDTEVFSIGTVLVKMRAVARDDLARVLEEQERMTEDELIGALLVRAGLITEEQLREALDTQRGLRSRRPFERAMAAARLAGRASERVRTLAGAVRAAVGELRRGRTGEGYAAITPAMLAAEKKDD